MRILWLRTRSLIQLTEFPRATSTGPASRTTIQGVGTRKEVEKVWKELQIYAPFIGYIMSAAVDAVDPPSGGDWQRMVPDEPPSKALGKSPLWEGKKTG